MNKMRISIALILLVILAACSSNGIKDNEVLVEYQISEKAVCLFPHNSWLPAFYQQYNVTAYTGDTSDYDCAANHGTFQCEIQAVGKCSLTYTEYGEEKQEIFNCYGRSGNVFHCYDGDQSEYEYIQCRQSSSVNYMTCSKSEQFFSPSVPAPSPPWFNYNNLSRTIRHFTRQSINNAGLSDQMWVVDVQAPPGKPATIILAGYNEQLMNDFAVMQQRFMDDKHAAQGLAGVRACQETEGCWEPYIGNSPWAFYLPLGLAIINHKIVNYLNYPPYDALTSGDYLDNFTMDRWNRILKSSGIPVPQLYDTIVDARPIAAPGSGQGPFLPDIMNYFNNTGEGRDYNIPMISLLNDPPSNTSTTHTLPVMVLGSDSRKAWAEVTGQPEQSSLPYVGSVTLDGASKTTSWVATNHPDVTTYQCCPGDPSPSCQSGGYTSFSLVKDEQIDMQAICTAQMLSEKPELAPADALNQCATEWISQPSEANLQTLCINAKMDYNFTSTGRCEEKIDGQVVPSYRKALAFCQYYQNNACPTDVYTCEVP